MIRVKIIYFQCKRSKVKVKIYFFVSNMIVENDKFHELNLKLRQIKMNKNSVNIYKRRRRFELSMQLI